MSNIMLPVSNRKTQVRVSDLDFYAFLANCKSLGKSQADMKRAFAEKFGGAEGSAIQKYRTFIEAYQNNIKALSEKEKTEDVEKTISELQTALTKIYLSDGRKKTAIGEDKSQALINLMKMCGDIDEKVGEMEEKPTLQGEVVDTLPIQQQPLPMGQSPIAQLPTSQGHGQTVTIQTGKATVTVHTDGDN